MCLCSIEMINLCFQYIYFKEIRHFMVFSEAIKTMALFLKHQLLIKSRLVQL